MAYFTTTTIIGKISNEPKPARDPMAPDATHADYVAFSAWHARVLKISSMPGTWKPEAALRRARRLGIIGDVEILMRTGDTSGRGRGGIDAKYIATGCTITRIDVSAVESEEFAAEEAEFIHGEG